jgi:hypothetical protein
MAARRRRIRHRARDRAEISHILELFEQVVFLAQSVARLSELGPQAQ